MPLRVRTDLTNTLKNQQQVASELRREPRAQPQAATKPIRSLLNNADVLTPGMLSKKCVHT